MKKGKRINGLTLVVLVGAGIWYSFRGQPTESITPSTERNETTEYMITLKTSMGEIRFELYAEDAPKTVENFVKLANEGYYNGLTFHRVIKGFMIQGGDPNCGSTRSPQVAPAGPCGAGGPGYQFEDELNPETPSYKEGYKRGVVAMANAGPSTNGSQFFITLEDTPLPHNYTIFGKVIEGQGIVDAIGNIRTDQGDRPLSPVVIREAKVSQ